MSEFVFACNDPEGSWIEGMEAERGENPNYGPGNPDWERDRAREDEPDCDCLHVDLPAGPTGLCPICRRPK